MRLPCAHTTPPHRFRRDQRGFTGAEKALMICSALAIILVVSTLLSGGSQKAGGDAKRTLMAGTSSLSSGGTVGQLAPPGLIQAVGVAPSPGNAQAPGSAGPTPRESPPPQAIAPTPIANGQQDTAYDGAFMGAGNRAYPASTPISQIPPVLPSNGRPPNGTIIYVNGINTTKDAQFASIQDIANTTGAQVIGVHNSTEGTIKDLAQSLGDKADIGKNPAVDTLADTIYAAVKAGQPIHLIGHSQGGLILSRALSHVQQRLRMEDGLSRAQAQQAMSNIQVETFGAAAASYPDGPQYVHYVNRGDPVPSAFGLGWWGSGGAGAGAKVIRFNEPHWNPIDAHSFDNVYLPRRQPFDQARR